MKKLILYKTKWGTTKQYCEWIKEDVADAEIANVDEFDVNKLSEFDLIVLGSLTYMGKIQGVKFLENNWNTLKTKKVYLFSIGMIPTEDPASIESYNAIPEEIRNGLAGYEKFPGKVDVNKLNFFEKLIVKMKKSDNNTKPQLPDKSFVKPVVEFLTQG
ncbi:hypothetical protein KC660_00985 [Candidatus Dojkabacteria bacterium]|uniref:Flavodoxin-like domain-containing protein n=1 Tax=Candidatus Dojkabacteria bacterium TaxID=2099670 RepID=A0A955L314_9BACT|nr:hypothetical protein [Candidatus Dojkabacteria bacterium]